MAAFIELAHGKDRAVVSTTGAALLDYTVDGRPVVVPMGAFDGAVLAPWPNRIDNGRYDFDGRSHQLPINEAARSTALHGLVADVDWDIVERDTSSVTLRTDLSDVDGYPFDLGLEVAYALATEDRFDGIGGIGAEKPVEPPGAGASCIRVRARARNRGSETAPFGFGFHPWIHPGSAGVDDAALLVPAETWLERNERLIPTAVRPFDTGSLIPADHEADSTDCLLCKDFRALRPLGSTVLDDALGTPQHGGDGWSRARLRGADGRTVVIGMDEGFRTWQVCTGDELDPRQRRRAIAIEPMTCPPNAFATGEEFDVIGPGSELSVEWSIALM